MGTEDEQGRQNESESPAAPVNPGGIILTFDDFSLSWLELIPLLRHYSVHATFYFSPYLCRWEDEEEVLQVLQALVQAGHEIGWHSMSHPDLRKIPAEEREAAFQREIAGPLAVIQDVLETEIHSFAYPYGFFDEDWELRLAPLFTSRRGIRPAALSL